MDNQEIQQANEQRQEWIGLLGCADPADLESEKKKMIDSLGKPLGKSIDYTYIVRPETGMIMVQAKQDGSGSRFNLGEVTVSRCIVQIQESYIGYAMVMGADQNHADLAAFFDALIQMPGHGATLRHTLLPKLREKQVQMDQADAADTQTTVVDFFTLKRGE